MFDDTGTLRFACDSRLDALLSLAPNPQLLCTASHDWVALVHTFYGILHPVAVQPLLNLEDHDIQVTLCLLSLPTSLCANLHSAAHKVSVTAVVCHHITSEHFASLSDSN